jgi:hypothetical protein
MAARVSAQARGAAGEIAAVMGWSLPYTLGVLGRWKMAAVYCQAVPAEHWPSDAIERNLDAPCPGIAAGLLSLPAQIEKTLAG